MTYASTHGSPEDTPEERARHIADARALDARLPKPWQQGHYEPMFVAPRPGANVHIFDSMYEARERRTVRGPGRIGSPDCNVLMETNHEAHAKTIVDLRNALADVIAEIDRREREHAEEVAQLFRKFSQPQPVALCNHTEELQGEPDLLNDLAGKLALSESDWRIAHDFEEHYYDVIQSAAALLGCRDETEHGEPEHLLALATAISKRRSCVTCGGDGTTVLDGTPCPDCTTFSTPQPD